MMRSAASRIAVIYSTTFVLATIVLGVTIYYAAHVALERQLDDRIAAEMSSLVSEYRGEGLVSVVEVIGRREVARATTDLRYALFAANGHRLAGSLDTRKPVPGWSTISFADPHDGDDRARALSVKLVGGESLVVAADWDELEDTDQLILTILGIAFLAEVIIGVGGAIFLGAYLRRRLVTINAAAEAIIAGDFAKRVIVSPRGDEFDRVSAALNTMLDRISELLDNLRQVSSDVAHDLRTPLTRLRNGLDEGLRCGAASDVIERAIERSDEVLSLFSAILRISEVEAGRLRAAFAPVDLCELVREVGESYAPAIEEGRRGFVLKVDSCPLVAGDRELLAQAVTNLLENAQAHTPEGTIITLTLWNDAAGTHLRVADTGPGVPIADRERILQRFARLEASRTRPGYGLGLSLVAAVARMHGASIILDDCNPGLSVELLIGAGQR